MKRVLMVSYYYPPLGGIGSLRAMKFADYLPEFHWQPSVLAPRRGSYFVDQTLDAHEQRVIRTNSFEISRFGRAAVGIRSDGVRPAKVGRFLSPVRDWVRRRIYRPDAQIGWYPFAVRAGIRATKAQRPDAIFSTSSPVTCHLIARYIHQRTGIPWVAEFRDVWTEDMPEGASINGLRAMEDGIIRGATLVTSVSQAWADLYRRRGARAVGIVTNGFDPTDYPPPGSVPRQMKVVHMGSFYPHKQDLSGLWRVLRGETLDETLGQLSIQFVGDLSVAGAADIARHGLDSRVSVTGFLPHRDALAHIASAAVLVVAGGVTKHSVFRGMIPAKIFEYLGTGRPILCLGDPETEAARIVTSQPGGYAVSTDDEAGIRAALLDALKVPFHARSLEAYTRRNLAGQLAELLDRAVAESQQGALPSA